MFNSDDMIGCILTETSSPPKPDFTLHLDDLMNRTDLISVHDDRSRAYISPPLDSQFYTKLGRTVVRCRYMDDKGTVEASQNLTVWIIRECSRCSHCEFCSIHQLDIGSH